MIELACKNAVFHFNKKHLQDPTVPMWVVKARGETYYVQHVECSVPWSTKETPDNDHTKGSIKIKDCLISIDDENCAGIKQLETHDIVRLHHKKKGITRIEFTDHNFKKSLQDEETVEHSPIKSFTGGCSSTFYVCDILAPESMSFLTLKYFRKFRIIMSNEERFKAYDDPKVAARIDWDTISDVGDDD